jgi:hypothetical protein
MLLTVKQKNTLESPKTLGKSSISDEGCVNCD